WISRSWAFCDNPRTASTTQSRARTSSNSESVPRSGIRRHLLGSRSAAMGTPSICVLVVDANSCLALAAEQSRRSEDHDQKEQNEEEHLSIGCRNIIAAD